MKRPGLTPHLASATLFLALAASGLHGAQPAKPPASAEHLAEVMKRLDRDGDGKLDDAERAAAKEILLHEQLDLQTMPPQAVEPVPAGSPGTMRMPDAFRQRIMEMFDKNGDGRLEGDERVAAEKYASEQGFGRDMRDEMLKRFDKNGNGRIDPQERAAVQEFMRQRIPKSAPAPKRETNDNAALEKLLRSAVEKTPAQLRRFDADKDGRLDDQEWAAARREIQRLSNDVPAAKPTPQAEQKRLEATAAEVKRRREMRENAKKETK